MNKQDLAPYFGSKEAILTMFSEHQRRGKMKQERHVYVDNGAPFLLVAHIDTVQTPRLDRVNRGAGFDDRLGVYLGHKLVRERSHLFDLLLTDYEEKASSTALYFTPSHDYKLVIELDREGEDYVDYGLASDKLHAALKECGFTFGEGSFSDICFMDHVKCNKINIGLGTKHGHSKHSRFDMGVFYRQVKRLLDFSELNRDKHWPEADGNLGWGWGLGKFGRYDLDGDICDVCLDTVKRGALHFNRQKGVFECDRCRAASDSHYAECESCGDPHPIEDLVYDPLYEGFLCPTCHYVLHEEDDHEEDQTYPEQGSSGRRCRL